MDRAGYRPPYMPEPIHAPNYRPQVPRSEAPWPPRFGAPPHLRPQYGPPTRQPPHYNGTNNSIGGNKRTWFPETGALKHEGPVGVETGWLGPAASGADGPGQATLPYHAEINCAGDGEPSRTMEVDNRNTWQQQNDYQTSNTRNTVMFPAGMSAMPPNRTMVPSHNMSLALPPPSLNMTMAPPPPSPNMSMAPPPHPPGPCNYPYPPPQTTEFTQPSPAQSIYPQRPLPDHLTVAPPGGHMPQPVTQYSSRPLCLKETIPNTSTVPSHPVLPGTYADSQTSSSLPESVPQGCDKGILEEKDQVWVSRWLERQGHFRRRNTKSQKQITIPEARMKLRAAVLLSDKLQHCCTELDTSHTESERKDLCGQVEQLKEELRKLKAVFEDGQTVAELQRKIRLRMKKRERLRRQRMEEYQEKLDVEEKRKKAHERLDQWQQSLVEKTLQLKRDKELKAAADDTLREVRSKLTDTKKALQLMTDLQKLRHVRKEMAEKKGLFVRHDIDKNFETRISSLVDMLTRQNEMYETEKGLLEVMLETEQQETEEREKEEQEKKLAAREQRCERRIRRVLFGHDEPLLPTHPLFPYRQYYEAGECNADTFLRIRQDWDMFLVPPGTEGGSRIPLNWVVPTEPSSDVWATASVK